MYENATFDNVQPVILCPSNGGGVFCARLEPYGLGAGCFRLLHYGGRLWRRHNHICDRWRFGQIEQAPVGGIALNQTLALIDRIDTVTCGFQLPIDSIAVFGRVVAGAHHGPKPVPERISAPGKSCPALSCLLKIKLKTRCQARQHTGRAGHSAQVYSPSDWACQSKGKRFPPFAIRFIAVDFCACKQVG